MSTALFNREKIDLQKSYENGKVKVTPFFNGAKVEVNNFCLSLVNAKSIEVEYQEDGVLLLIDKIKIEVKEDKVKVLAKKDTYDFTFPFIFYNLKKKILHSDRQTIKM